MRSWVLLAALAGCASAPPAGSTLAHADDEPSEGDASVEQDAAVVAANIRASELRWLAAHLADDASPNQIGDSPAVRRLVTYGASGVRVVAEVFRAGDERRATYARAVIERVMRAHCRRDEARVARTRRWLFGAAADASVVAWPEGSRWPLERVERLRAWADHEAPCDPDATPAELTHPDELPTPSR